MTHGSRTARLDLANRREAPHRVAVEPWAIEYTLSPGEALTIVAAGPDAGPQFSLLEWDGATQVYCDGATSYEVVQGDRVLPAGYTGRNHQPATVIRHLPGNPLA